MQKEGTKTKTKFQSGRFRESIGKIVYNNYELRFMKKGELDSILLSRLEFELLVDNEIGQQQLVKRHGGNSVEELVAIFRNEDQTAFTIQFNSGKIKVYNFTKSVDEFDFITKLDHKKVYAEFLLV